MELRRNTALLITRRDAESKTIEASLSSETPVWRPRLGHEILVHTPEAVDLRRFPLPVNVSHDTGRLNIGLAEHPKLIGKKLRAVLRFGESSQAREVWGDVAAGIVRNVSIAYDILDAVHEPNEIYKVVRWQPFEVSLVSVPADSSVGIGRSYQSKGNLNMEDTSQWTVEEKEQHRLKMAEERGAARAKEEEQERVHQLLLLGRMHKMPELARKAIHEGWTIEQTRAKVLEHYKPEPIVTPDISLTEQEVKKFSFLRAITAMAQKDWRGAGFERECSDAVAQRMGRPPRGCYVPWEVLNERRQLTRAQRDLLTTGHGSNVVATNLLADAFIDILRNSQMVRRLGATVLGGLVGNVSIPRKTGASPGSWVTENTAPTEGSITFDQVTLSPKSVTTFVDYSRKLMLQSTPDIEQLVRQDFASTIGVAIDLAALHGSSVNNSPDGLQFIPGVGEVVGGTNGASPTYSHIVQLETEVSRDNAMTGLGSFAYLSNSRIRAALKQTQRFTSTDSPVWETGDPAMAQVGIGLMNSYPAAMSNQARSDLVKGSSSGNISVSAIFFGNWRDLLIGEWGTLDILVDPYTGSSAGTTRVRVFMDVDIAVRHPESFARMLDATQY